MKRFIALTILAMSLTSHLYAELPAIGDWSVEAGVNTSRVIPTNSFLRSVDGNDMTVAPELRTAFSFGDSTRYGLLYHNVHVRQGIAVNLNNFIPHSSFGHPAGLYIFQAVRIAGTDRLNLTAEWNFGMSVGWRKYGDSEEISNTAIGSKVNAILGIGLNGTWRFAPHWGLKGGINAYHYSNGNTNLPNAGVNTVGMLVGAQYYFEPLTSCHRMESIPTPFKRGFSYDLTAYGALRRRIAVDGVGDYVVAPGSFAVAGIDFGAMYDLNRYFRFGLSLDMQYDESANLAGHIVPGSVGEDLRFYRQPFADCFAAGLSLRAELTLPVFSINAGIGRNIIANGPDTRAYYQILALKAYLWRGAFLQVGYQLRDFHLPNNLMLGLGYTFGKK